MINAGGLINVYVELHGYDRRRALTLTREINSRLRKIFSVARLHPREMDRRDAAHTSADWSVYRRKQGEPTKDSGGHPP